jgi:hypothetical protein
MSRDNQRALGLQAAAHVYQQMPILPDSSPETQYIQQLGKKLVATIPAEYSWPYEFHVVAQKEINAFALPGGPMFVNIGAITAAANEAQLAGVMGHEMSHVYLQHSAKQAGQEKTTSILAGIAGAVLGGVGGGAVGQLGEMGIKAGAEGLTLKHSRTDEAQADALGAVIIYKAGYNPQALGDFFETLESQGGTPPQWLSDHPNPGNRQKAIEKEVKDWPPEDYAGDSPAFQQVRVHAQGVKAYTAQEIAQGAKSGEWASINAKNGATFNPTTGHTLHPTASSLAPDSPNVTPAILQSVLPNQRMVTANLGPVTISHPDNWEVTVPHQKGHFVTIAPPAGVTHKGIGYGVLLNGVAPRQGQVFNIDEITAELVQQLQQNHEFQPLGSAKPITVGAIQGRSVMSQSPSPFPSANGQSQTERDWLVTLPQRDGSVIFMVFVAPESDFARLQPTYDAMLKSVQLP